MRPVEGRTLLLAESQFNRKAKMGRFPAAFTFTFAFLFFSLFINTAGSFSSYDNKIPCSKSCVAMNCDTVGIKYGKYCGVGHSGCPGEKACDDLDACCQIHDDCVGKHGGLTIKGLEEKEAGLMDYILDRLANDVKTEAPNRPLQHHFVLSCSHIIASGGRVYGLCTIDGYVTERRTLPTHWRGKKEMRIPVCFERGARSFHIHAVSKGFSFK